MKAAVLERFGAPLAVRDVPDPVPGPDDVVVAVEAALVLPYTAEVFSGQRRYPLEPPVIPGIGAIGTITAVGSHVPIHHVGRRVWCDPTVRSRDDVADPAITLQGWSSRGEAGLALSRIYHDGAFAESMRLPVECAHPVGPGDPSRQVGIAIPLVPYGGLSSVDFRPGETLLVSGATGNYGSAAVLLGLALGAAAVVAAGRNEAVLADLRRRGGARVRTVVLTGDDEADRVALTDAGPIDVVLDLLPPAAPSRTTRAAAMAVRPYGRVSLMGGVGMLGGADLELPYPWLMRNGIMVRGQWMAPREANRRLLDLLDAGVLDLSGDDVTTFGLGQANDAVAHAAAHGGPFQRTVLLPGR